MLSVSRQLLRSPIPVLRGFPYSGVPRRCLTFSETHLTSSRNEAEEQFEDPVDSISRSTKANSGIGGSFEPTAKTRPSRWDDNIIRKVKASANDSKAFFRLVEPRAGSGTLPWQQRIKSFEQLNYESSLNVDPRLGLRLVDDVNYRHDPDLWLTLIRYRERIDGVKGIAVIWKGFWQRFFRFKDSTYWPKVSPTKDIDRQWHDIYMSFLQAGFADRQILKEVCEYICLNHGSRVREVNGLYMTVIRHILKVEPSEVFQWHQQLKVFLPNPKEQIELFDQTVASLPARRALLGIYSDLPYPRLYSSVIPRLCARELYSEAVSWHRMLLSRGDRPSSTSVVKPLLEHLVSSDKEDLAAQITLELVDAGVVFDTTAAVSQKDIPVISRQIMSEAHAKFYNISPKRLTDEFCARLIATKIFSVKSIISGLQILGVQAIGPLALREVVARTVVNESCQSDEVAVYLDQMDGANIQLGSSKFSRLVQRLVHGNRNQLLYDVVTCDQHPDVFEDRKLQETLLASYRRAGDDRQVNRTVAILTLDEKEETMDVAYWNFFLRCDLTLLNLSGLLKTAETMRGRGIPLTHTSRSYMWSKLMTHRQSGRSTHDKHIQTLVSIWQGFMTSGTYIPLSDWSEILRRLGMTGQLTAYESLVFWLAKWYTDGSFRKSLVGGLKRVEESKEYRKYSMQLSQVDPVHPFQILFSKKTQHALLAWGFQKKGMTNLDGLMLSARVDQLASSDCLWGLRMIVRLKDFGINIDRNTISRLCRMRMKSMFGTRHTTLKREHQVPCGRQGRWDEYVLAMEMIWGQDLFSTNSNSKGTTAQTLSVRERLPRIRAEIFLGMAKNTKNTKRRQTGDSSR